MARYTRFEMPVDPDNMEAAAQALFAAVQAQRAALPAGE